MTERIVSLLIGYAFGLFQTGYLYGKMKGIDIRNYGSGNAGTTNALRTLGKKAGLITFLGDCLKCLLAVLAARIIFGAAHPEQRMVYGMYAAAGAILGHNFPFYLKFKGGKGIACTAGLIASFNWVMIIIGLVCFLTPFLTTHYVSLGSLLVYIGFVVGMVIMGQTGYLGMEQIYLNEMYVIAVLLAVMSFWRHRQNIVRLIHGSERKTYLSKKNRAEENIQNNISA